MVTFDHRALGKTGFGPAAVSQKFEAAGFDQLVIRTSTNDWFINSDTNALEAALTSFVSGYDRVQSLGYSMGGYGAFRFAGVLGTVSVVAVSPQATLDRATVPWERRYRAEARGFDAALGDLEPRAVPGLRGLVLFDPFLAADRFHADLIAAQFPGVDLVRLPGADHPATKVLRQGRRAWIVQREAMAEVPDRVRVLKDYRGLRGGVPLYWENLARALSRAGKKALADQVRGQWGGQDGRVRQRDGEGDGRGRCKNPAT